MATGLRKDSRYRALRGKSVSEHHKDLVQVLGDDIDSTTLSPNRSATTTWRRRSKTQGQIEMPDASSMDNVHSQLLSVPPLPHLQKEHTSTTRPKAAIIPPRPEFGRPISPSPLGKRSLDQAVASSTSAVDDVAVSDKIATDGGDDHQARELETVPDRDVGKEDDDEPLEHTDTVHQHDRRDSSPLSRSEAETDRMLAEQKRLLHQELMTTDLATESMHSLPSTFSFATRSPPKTPILGKLGFFSRGRSSRATFSPASSTIASMDSDRTQSTEPLLSSGAYMAFNQQLLTPPLSPIFASGKKGVVSSAIDCLIQSLC